MRTFSTACWLPPDSRVPANEPLYAKYQRGVNVGPRDVSAQRWTSAAQPFYRMTRLKCDGCSIRKPTQWVVRLLERSALWAWRSGVRRSALGTLNVPLLPSTHARGGVTLATHLDVVRRGGSIEAPRKASDLRAPCHAQGDDSWVGPSDWALPSLTSTTATCVAHAVESKADHRSLSDGEARL